MSYITTFYELDKYVCIFAYIFLMIFSCCLLLMLVDVTTEESSLMNGFRAEFLFVLNILLCNFTRQLGTNIVLKPWLELAG